MHACPRFSTLLRRVALALLVSATLASAQQADYARGVVVVKFRADADQALVQRVIARHGLKLQRVIARIGARRFNIPAGQHELVFARLIASYPIVEYAEPDYLRYASVLPTDPRFNEQWDMTNIRMPQAWDITKGNASVVVAVADTGMDLDHPDLVNSLWQNTDEIANNSKDDDNNGYVDDRNGYDFAGDGIFPLPEAEDSVPADISDHGTHVSGTIAATQNNGIGVTGVAPLCKVMPVRVLGGRLGTGYSSDISEGVIYAVDNGAKVVNMSLGGTARSLNEYNAIKYAWENNVLVCAAAGNSGDTGNPIEYPAAYPFSMSVGATGPLDAIASFSTHNGFVDVSAPGVDILSTIPDNTYDGDGWSGTSMATPHVSGLAALVYAKHPGIANWEVRTLIQQGAVELGTPNWDQYYGFGRIDAATTLGLARPNPAALKLLEPNNGSIINNAGVMSFLWNPVTGAASYRLVLRLPNNTTRTFAVNGTYGVSQPNNPVPTGIYYATVEALNGGGGVIATSPQIVFTKTN